jgi:hypothetical protein
MNYEPEKPTKTKDREDSVPLASKRAPPKYQFSFLPLDQFCIGGKPIGRRKDGVRQST